MTGALLHPQLLRRNRRRSREWERDSQSDSIVAERVANGLPRNANANSDSDEDADSVIINMMTIVVIVSQLTMISSWFGILVRRSTYSSL
jgi:hypothetical protein